MHNLKTAAAFDRCRFGSACDDVDTRCDDVNTTRDDVDKLRDPSHGARQPVTVTPPLSLSASPFLRFLGEHYSVT